MEVKLHAFLIWNYTELVASRSNYFTPHRRVPCTTEQRAWSDVVAKKMLHDPVDIRTQVVEAIDRRFTDSTIPILCLLSEALRKVFFIWADVSMSSTVLHTIHIQ